MQRAKALDNAKTLGLLSSPQPAARGGPANPLVSGASGGAGCPQGLKNRKWKGKAMTRITTCPRCGLHALHRAKLLKAFVKTLCDAGQYLSESRGRRSELGQRGNRVIEVHFDVIHGWSPVVKTPIVGEGRP